MREHFCFPLLDLLARFAQADQACVPNASTSTIPTVVPKVGQTPRTRVRIDNNTAVFLRNLPPHNVVGELPLDIAEKISPILPRKCSDIFGALQELDMAGKITPILVREYVDIFRISQEEYSRRIENGHCVLVTQAFQAELHSLAPLFPALVYIKPETIRLWMSTLQIAHPAQFYRIRCPMIVRHAAKYRRMFKTLLQMLLVHHAQRHMIVITFPITYLYSSGGCIQSHIGSSRHRPFSRRKILTRQCEDMPYRRCTLYSNLIAGAPQP